MKFYALTIILLGYGIALKGQDLAEKYTSRVHIADTTGQLVFETLPVKSKVKLDPEKIYFWYAANRIHETQGGLGGKPLNGTYQASFPNKQIKNSGNFTKGLKNGVWNVWDKRGLLKNTYT
jgi:antitoxin component YwqK of YwqJK toxin-antitoxin module